MIINTLEFRLDWDGEYEGGATPKVEVTWGGRPVYAFAVDVEQAQRLSYSQAEVDEWAAERIGEMFARAFGREAEPTPSPSPFTATWERPEATCPGCDCPVGWHDERGCTGDFGYCSCPRPGRGRSTAQR